MCSYRVRGSLGRSRAAFTAARQLFQLLLIGLALVAGPTAVSAQRSQDRPNADQAEAAIAQLRSPYCPGLMLEVCPSPSAAALRDSIYDLAAQGETTDQIVGWMLARHGEEWRGVPQRSGVGLWAWIVPPIALLIGIGLVAGWMRSSRAQSEMVETSPATEMSDGDREKLAAALREWEESGEDEV